jgi:nucleotide-binding universal stress UspA family protein
MYKHILLPVDGSDFGMGSIPYAINLAKAVGARLTALNVSIPYAAIVSGALAARFPEEDYLKGTHDTAAGNLKKVEAIATAAGVPYKGFHAFHLHPWESIIETAKEQGCDLIVMASHGRRGLAGLLLGSETKKVLTHTTTPVLVWRGA